MENLATILKDEKTVVVDVRTPGEYMGGHVAGSKNIPLDEVPGQLNYFKGLNKVVLCCASGNRSGHATQFLKQQGIDCVNGGAWTNVNYFKNN